MPDVDGLPSGGGVLGRARQWLGSAMVVAGLARRSGAAYI
jgi:hypothetical protein